MAEVVIKTNELTKYYGKARGIVDLSVDVRKGEIFGFLGPNGAGKTTTIRTLLDFIRPTSGSATIFGLDVHAETEAIKRRTGYLPGELSLYENLTGAEFLRYAGNLRGSLDWNYAQGLAARLDCDLTRRIEALSQGNKRKVGLVQALMHRPELIILDEPTNGLDPLVQQEFYRIVEEIRQEGRTVFLSSHNLPEVERVCDRVAIIRGGRLVAVEDVRALKSRALRQIEIRFASPVAQEDFTGISGVRDVEIDDGILHCSVQGSLDALIKKAAQFEVVNIISHEPNLEQIFLAYYGGGNNHAA